MRGILRQKKIGHTGTLDPEAEGVLPVCLGAGTRLCDMLTDQGKTYEAVLLLGQITDTQDATGTVLESYPVEAGSGEVLEVIRSFVGQYDQIPPMYSALKVNGKKLYELARAGVEVERKPRPVEIYDIRILEVNLPEVTFTVECSKGTYIRTLCHDIGAKLGCGGCMKSLKRIRVGSFQIEDSLTLGQIEALRDQEKLGAYIFPVDSMFPEAPAVTVLPEFEKLLLNGNPLKSFQMRPCSQKILGAERIRMYSAAGKFCGLYRLDKKRKLYVPEKMFLEA